MKNYNEMTDSDINACVEKEWFEDRVFRPFFNPCSNPSHAWPIIVKHGISLDYWVDYWSADIQHEGEVGYEYEDKNALRAAMICYLMMKDDE